MARIKLYYPVDEITPNLYTSGQQWMTTDNKEYIGLYHSYTTGEIYTGAVWDLKTSVALIPYKEQNDQVKKNATYQNLKSELKLKYSSPVSIPIQIKKDNLYAGNIQRYFIKKYNETPVIEIDRYQYDLWQANVIDSKLYNVTQLTWHITGNISDTLINGVFIEGVTTKNKKQVALASVRLPELQTTLTNYIEYYSDGTFIIPADINGLDS